MSLFDYIHYKGEVFQTKDTETQYLHDYYIENGRLLKSTGHTEDRSDRAMWVKANPGKRVPEKLEGLVAIGGCMSWVETGRQDVNFHGLINFYGESGEFLAKFTDGQLVEITACAADED